MRRGILFLLVLTFTFILSNQVFASDTAQMNADKFGFFTLLPPLIAIVLAFITKNVIISLFIGALSGSFILVINDYNILKTIISAFVDFTARAIESLADSWNAAIILQLAVIGGLIFLIGKMGGARAIAQALAKKAKGPVSTQIVTWILSIIIFFDDYASLLLVGPIMKPLSDKMKVSREKLAFILDATASPIAGIVIISTWIGLEISLISEALSAAGLSLGEADAFSIFIKTMPYRFYNILIILFAIITAIACREFGPMYDAEYKARRGEILKTIDEQDIDNELEAETNIKLNIYNAIIPIFVLIVGAILSFYLNGYYYLLQYSDAPTADFIRVNPLSLSVIRDSFANTDAPIALFQAALVASIVAIAMAVVQKIFTLVKAIEVWTNGMKNMLITSVILILAWSLSSVVKEIGTAFYLSELLSDKIAMFLLPALIFFFGSAISFSTSSAFGTMSMLMPLAVPLSIAIQPEGSFDFNFVIICTSAVLTGAVFGDHCSPISDTTILASIGASCDQMSHVRTQMPYAVVVGLVTVFAGYIPAGFGVSPWLSLLVSLFVLIFIVYKFGKKISN